MIEFLQRRAPQGAHSPALRVADLKTGRLRLVTITPQMLVAEHNLDAVNLARLLKAKLTAEWPPADWEPPVHQIIQKQYEEWPGSFGWHRYVLLESGLGWPRTLVGAVGGFPRVYGDVEIAYSTLPAFQRRGFATAFVTKLVEWLLTLEEVQSVSAQTYARVPESIKIMERCGMKYVGGGDDAGTVRYRRAR